MKPVVHGFRDLSAGGWAICALAALGAIPGDAGAATLADSILTAANLNAGLCVNLGTTDGKLETDLCKGGAILVQGLALGDARRDAARAAIAAAGVYGFATVDGAASLSKLPYADNLVDLLVADLDALGAKAPPDDEILRVIAPGGGLAYVKQGGAWTKRTKPLNRTDEWNYWDYSTGANPVSNDSLVGPPAGIQWNYPSDGHSLGGSRISGGTAYSLYEARDPYHHATRLAARDAFNGLLKWDLKDNVFQDFSLNNYFYDGGRLYGFFALGKPMAALDGKTGAALKTYDQGLSAPADTRWGANENTKKLLALIIDGVLVQAWHNRMVALDVATGQKLWEHTDAPDAWYTYLVADKGKIAALVADTAQFGYFARTQSKGYSICRSIIGLDPHGNGTPAWRNTDMTGKRVQNLASKDGKLVAASFEWITGTGKDQGDKGEMLVSRVAYIDIGNGGAIWKKDFPTPTPGPDGIWPTSGWPAETFVVKGHFPMAFIEDNRVIIKDRGNVQWLDLANGAKLDRVRVPLIQNWCGYLRGAPGGLIPMTGGYMSFAQQKAYYHYASRSACDVGTMPAYGLHFVPAQADCGCIPLVRGFTALCARYPWTPVPDGQRLVKGTATVQDDGSAWPKAGEWPAFLANGARGGNVSTTLPAANFHKMWDVRVAPAMPQTTLTFDWESNETVPGPATPPVVAEGKVFVADMNGHRLDAYDPVKSAKLWSFTTDGRIYGPPTVYKGMVLLGCRDGWLYALNTNGQLAWKFQAAPWARQVVVAGQLESSWPLFGSPLMVGGKLFISAGRQNESDSGIFVYKLDPFTGAQLGKTVITGRARDTDTANDITSTPKMINDVMATDGKLAYVAAVAVHPGTMHWSNMRAVDFDTKPVFPNDVTDVPVGTKFNVLSSPVYGMYGRRLEGAVKDAEGLRYGGFWTYNDWSRGVYGRKLGFNGKDLFSVWRGTVYHYTLDAQGTVVRDGANNLVEAGKWDMKNYPGGGWTGAVAVLDNQLAVAIRAEGGSTGELRIYDYAGAQQFSAALDGAPAENGLAVANGQVFVTLMDGRLLAFGNGTVSIKAHAPAAKPQVAAAPKPQTLEWGTARKYRGALPPASVPAAAPQAAVAAGPWPAPADGAVSDRSDARDQGAAPAGSPRTEAAAMAAQGYDRAAPAEPTRYRSPEVTKGSPAAGDPARPLHGALREIWYGLGGSRLQDLVAEAYYPAQPSGSEYLATLSPAQGGRNYGERVRAWVRVPKTGTYGFDLKATGEARLRLETDRGGELFSLPSGPRTGKVRLEKGKRYLLEVLHKQGDGGEGRLDLMVRRPGSRKSATLDPAWIEPVRP